ncbi:hypothetical protein KCG48_10275 [Proteiniclasticum sp. BAD-10]|uniref:Uncharacterized protein n=1 Tax=Proteiniclasticum sediminis TaxID=2804028 RepID=A0A941HRL0_9CLOT|nr:hypothetical protein [Proteiniclasticum sediminis]MBR0576718.1 hypothetical protein [Proteiniclasticum sediminis]
MSLVSMLKDKTPKSIELQRIIRSVLPSKNQFTTLSGAMAFDAKALPVTPYNSDNLKYAALTGTAIELMAKYHIGRASQSKQEKIKARNTGLAVQGLEILQNTLPMAEFKEIYQEYNKNYTTIRNYVENKPVEMDELISAAMISSKLENYKRSFKLPEKPIPYFIEDLPRSVTEDLRGLFQGFLTTFVDTGLIHEGANVEYHPIFGKVSLAVGGADADLYIDGTMYDFKTSKNRGYEWQEVAQLMGYALFSDISSEFFELHESDNNNEFPYKTDRIGLYRTRFNEIDYFELSKIPSQDWDTARSDLKKLFRL